MAVAKKIVKKTPSQKVSAVSKSRAAKVSRPTPPPAPIAKSKLGLKVTSSKAKSPLSTGVLIPKRSASDAVDREIFDKQAGLILAITEAVRLEEMRIGRAMKHAECSSYFGVSRTSYAGVLNCKLYLPNCGRQTVEGFAKGLKIPVLQVYLLCGFFKETDCIYVSNLDDDLNSIFRSIISRAKDFILESPSLAVWSSWPLTAKYHFVLMYETAAQRTLLKKASIQPPKDASSLRIVPKH